VLVHWSTFVVLAILALTAISNPIYAVLFIGSYLSIIFAHEFGHAFVANRLGWRVHSIGVTFWHGWCRHEEPDTEWDDVLISWGGVAAQAVIALPVLIGALLFGDRDWGYFTPIVVLLGYLNLVLAAVNLLPDDETDGRLAWRVVPLLLEEWRTKRADKE
jgi:Zn-dependent protease